MAEFKAYLVDSNGNLLGTAANPLKVSGLSGSGLWEGYARPSSTGNESKFLKYNSTATMFECATPGDISSAWGGITGTLSDQIDLQTALDARAVVATNVTYYVNEDAAGTGDGSSYTNGFTSLQAAIDAAPEFCTLTIYVRKGSTNYSGDSTLIYKHGITQINIIGEYSWTASCESNAIEGRIVDSDIVTTGMAVGDRVVCMHYTGTVNASSIDDQFYATVTEVGVGYVQTSEGTKVPTTGWVYLINSTLFDGNNSTNKIIAAGTVPYIAITGIGFVNQDDTTPVYISNGLATLTRCIFYQTRGISVVYKGLIAANTCGVIGTAAGAYPLVNATNNSFLYITTSAISGANTYGLYASQGSRIYGKYLNINGTTYGAYSNTSECHVQLDSCYIESTVTTGLYGYNLTFTNGTNNASTGSTPSISGGKIADSTLWNGQTLPTFTGKENTVLGLNSGGTALEFKTANRSIFLSLAGGWTGTTLPDAGFTTVETSTNKVNFKGTKFSASTLDQFHEFGCIMPLNYDGQPVTARFAFYVASSTDASDHTIILGLEGVSFGDGDFGDTAYGTIQTVTATVASSIAGKLTLTATTNPVTIGNAPAGGDWTQFRVSRSGSDTYTGDIVMLGVLISYGIDNYSDE